MEYTRIFTAFVPILPHPVVGSVSRNTFFAEISAKALSTKIAEDRRWLLWKTPSYLESSSRGLKIHKFAFRRKKIFRCMEAKK